MTVSEWQAVLEVIKLLLECAAIVAAAIWATYTFGSLRQIARARAEIANTEAERRKTEVEIQHLTEQSLVGAVIEIDRVANVHNIPESGLFLSVVAEVANKGNRNAQIEYPEYPFTAYTATLQGDGKFVFESIARAHVVSSVAPAKRSLKLLVRAGGRERLPFLVRIPRPGIYLLVVTLPLSAAEQEIAKKYGFVSAGRWSAKRYVVVQSHEGRGANAA
jgi:hypothetical protein